MKVTINKRLLPIKAHYFFFMAAMGPILPQINVFGKQLGIGPDVMGIITSVLPILYVLAKPIVGFIIDYFTHLRKLIFMLIILLAALCYSGFYFVPNVSPIDNFNTSNSTNSSTSHAPKIAEISYDSATFWSFVILMSLGTINFNVGNCVSDAICFDMLGDNNEMKFGYQRVFGTIGFGLTGLIGGIVVNQTNSNSITPALIIMLICTFLDLISVTKLKLPKMSSDVSILKEVKNLLKRREIVIFLVFATIAGVIDSFIIYYMFWHLEELAIGGPYESSIKLIEGCVIAAECLCGEILFFLVSGKIIKRIGYIHCFSVCFFTYAVRLYLISVITNPWYLVLVELFMQGLTYPLTYTCIVGYASVIATAGTTATVQGLVAGMDDGLGYAIGSMIGGQLYKTIGGKMSFRVFATISIVTCFAHILLRPGDLPNRTKPQSADTRQDIKYELPVEQKVELARVFD